jgi:hypothetical protein
VAVARVDPVAEEAGVSATAPLGKSASGSSGSFQVLADDEQRYWCKVINNPQGPRVLANEQIVGRLGKLIGAPVCEVELVYIPADLAGWEFRPGLPLIEGWAHGSLALEPVTETRSLEDRAQDDNARRHGGICALYDWMGGSDAQWLIRGPEREYYSHDHGHYFPGGPTWTIASLHALRDVPIQVATPNSGLDADELRRLADAVEAVSAEEIQGCIAKVPAAWPPSDAELDELVTYLAHRTAPVAERLRATAEAL